MRFERVTTLIIILALLVATVLVLSSPRRETTYMHRGPYGIDGTTLERK